MVKLAIIADDLTGACDSGIKLKNLGAATTVIVDVDRCGELPCGENRVISVSTNTRSACVETAADEVSRIVSMLKREGVQSFYKKVDSVLRGNTGCEVEACRVCAGADFALVAPEFPDNGRTIENGKLHIRSGNGISVCADALEAVRATAPNANCARIGLSDVRAGKDKLVRAIEAQVKAGAVIIIADAVTNLDMQLLAQAAEYFGSRCLPAGSAGWLPYLCDSRGFDGGVEGCDAAAFSTEGKHVIICVGSRHPVTLAQVTDMKAVGDYSHYLIEMSDDDHLSAENGVTELLNSIRSDAEKGRVSEGVLVTTTSIYGGVLGDELQLLTKNTDNKEVVNALSEAVSGIFDVIPVGGLVLTGGDTADGVLTRLGCGRLELFSEPLTGMVAGLADIGGEKLPVITKSGGFGGYDALDELFRYISSGGEVLCSAE